MHDDVITASFKPKVKTGVEVNVQGFLRAQISLMAAVRSAKGWFSGLCTRSKKKALERGP